MLLKKTRTLKGEHAGREMREKELIVSKFDTVCVSKIKIFFCAFVSTETQYFLLH